MKLLGRDIPARELIARIEERLRTRGLPTSEPVEVPAEGVEPRVEPLTFNLHALEENADATRALPLHTHRGGAGQLVLVAKWAFRKSCQVFINEALGRQRVFNGHVRDSYAQLSAEVIRLRREVEQLRARQGGGMPSSEDRRPVPAKTPPAPQAPSATRAPAVAPSAKPASATGQARGTGQSPSTEKPVETLSRVPAEQAPREPASGVAKPAPTERATPSPSKPPSGSRSAPSMKAASAERPTPPREPRASTRPASTARAPSDGQQASRSVKAAPQTKAAASDRQASPSAKAAPQTNATSQRKPSRDDAATPLAAGEPVLPKPRHARSGEGQSPRGSEGEGAPRTRSETAAPTKTGNGGQRPRKPGSQRRGRRK